MDKLKYKYNYPKDLETLNDILTDIKKEYIVYGSTHTLYDLNINKEFKLDVKIPFILKDKYILSANILLYNKTYSKDFERACKDNTIKQYNNYRNNIKDPIKKKEFNKNVKSLVDFIVIVENKKEYKACCIYIYTDIECGLDREYQYQAIVEGIIGALDFTKDFKRLGYKGMKEEHQITIPKLQIIDKESWKMVLLNLVIAALVQTFLVYKGLLWSKEFTDLVGIGALIGFCFASINSLTKSKVTSTFSKFIDKFNNIKSPTKYKDEELFIKLFCKRIRTEKEVRGKIFVIVACIISVLWVNGKVTEHELLVVVLIIMLILFSILVGSMLYYLTFKNLFDKIHIFINNLFKKNITSETDKEV